MKKISTLAAAAAFAASMFAPAAFASTAPNPAVVGKIKSYVSSNNLSCMQCHSITHKVVGPAWLSVAKKYETTPNAQAQLAKAIANGNSGIWGPIPMPGGMANTQQATKLAKMILGLASK